MEKILVDRTYLLDEIDSVNAMNKASRTSEKYSFVSTKQICEPILSQGWKVMSANQVRTKDEDRIGYQKHVIKFYNEDYKIDDDYPNIIFLNSHDGTSSLKILAGIFRLVCSNGLVVAKHEVENIRFIHKKINQSQIAFVMAGVIKQIPIISKNVEEMKKKELTRLQQIEFARKAMMIRWDEKTSLEIDPEGVLTVRRDEDVEPTLWNVYNKVQENLIKGGFQGIRHTVRAIKNVDRDITMNKQLWDLAITYK